MTVTSSTNLGSYVVTSKATVSQIDPATGLNQFVSYSFTITVESPMSCPDLLIPAQTLEIG